MSEPQTELTSPMASALKPLLVALLLADLATIAAAVRLLPGIAAWHAALAAGVALPWLTQVVEDAGFALLIADALLAGAFLWLAPRRLWIGVVILLALIAKTGLQVAAILLPLGPIVNP